MSEVYPLKFAPIYKPKIWGGRNLERLFARHLPEGEQIGESWELADLSEGVSVVAEGPAAGASLTEITSRWGDKLLGPAKPMPDGRFPLLVKLLDANDRLSLQVHPDAEAVRRIGPPAALKTECWYIVESRGGAIFKGIEPGISPERFREAIESDTVDQVVRRIDVAEGDFHYLPAGTVHAIGGGLVIAEVQTPSDTTYRVTDWGRGRQIHVDRSMQCIRFDLTDSQPGADGDTLLATEYFTVARRSVPAGEEHPFAEGLCTAVMTLSGGGALAGRADRGKAISIVAGETLLVPAGIKRPIFRAGTDTTFLEIRLPSQS